jgi:hypothetical protein
MTQTLINSQTPKGPYPGSISAGDLALAFSAADTSNGNSFKLTGHEVLLAYNSDASAHHLTITSTPDSRGRSADIASYSIPATSHAAFSFLSGQEGWIETDGTAHISADDTTVKLAVLYVQR